MKPRSVETWPRLNDGGRRRTKLVQVVVFGWSSSSDHRCRSSSLAAPRSKAELEEVRGGGEQARTTEKMRGCRATPRAFWTILASLDAVSKLGWRDRQLGFVVVLSLFRGVAGMAEIRAAQSREEGLPWERRERKSREERENSKFFLCFCLLVSGLKPDDIILEVFRNTRSRVYVK